MWGLKHHSPLSLDVSIQGRGFESVKIHIINFNFMGPSVALYNTIKCFVLLKSFDQVFCLPAAQLAVCFGGMEHLTPITTHKKRKRRKSNTKRATRLTENYSYIHQKGHEINGKLQLYFITEEANCSDLIYTQRKRGLTLTCS